MRKATQKTQAVSGPGALPEASLSELQKIRLFREIPNQALLLLQGKVRRAHVEADETILELTQDPQPFRYFFFITSGQVKILGFDEEARAKFLNFLRKGEFFVDKSIRWGGQIATKVVAITKAELLLLPRDELKILANRFPPFHEKLKSLTERVDYRNRIYSEDTYARSVLDFLIENELTQASRVKITQMDKCIECDICYTSCEERHGFQRLERGYARFGVLDFAQSCLTCFYPTCIPACPVEGIEFDVKKGEVRILDNCIGASACSRACQYGAIRLQKVDSEDSLFERFLGGDKKIQPKFVADKCDHCHGYKDMACISQCPTGAILEVEATELLENPRIFGAVKGSKRPLQSRLKRSTLESALLGLYILLSVLGTLGLIWEALALSRAPAYSGLLALQRAGWIESNFGLTFQRGSQYLNFLGNLGFSLILVGMLYPLRKAFPRLFKYLGTAPAFLDIHNFCGLMGTILILFHTGFVFPFQPSTFGFLALLLVTLSGLFGRFLYHVIPRGVAGTELRRKDIDEEDAGLNRKLGALVEDAGQLKKITARLIDEIMDRSKKNPSLWNLLKSLVRTRWLLMRFRQNLLADVSLPERQIQVFMDLLRQKVRLERNVAFLGLTSRLFIRWMYLHRPAAYVMAAIAIGHIIKHLFFFPNL